MTDQAQLRPDHTHNTDALVTDPLLLQQVVAVSGDAIFAEDLDGRVITWNAAAERLYGCPAVDMLGRSTVDLLPAETASQLRSVHALALSGERVDRFDTLHRCADGRQVPVSITVSPLRGPDGAVAGLATSVQDITDRVGLVAEVERAHSRLEVQNEALSRSNRDLEQFAYVASHDLSEPLRAMTGFVQLLDKHYAHALDERGVRYVGQVVDGAARMRSLIEDLLEYSRFLRSEPARTAVDTTAVARQVVSSLGAPGVEIEELPPVWCDEVSVVAVLNNLITNALKFHAPGAQARVVVSGQRVGARVQVCVDDNGIGIAPEHRQRVFGMFSRLHVREAYAGTGIGLAIVLQIAERSDGRVWIESSPLGGCRVCITLPASRTETSTRDEAAA